MSAAAHINGVSHVSINVSDMDRSIEFYRDMFGWEQLFDEHMEGPGFEAITAVPGRPAGPAEAASATSGWSSCASTSRPGSGPAGDSACVSSPSRSTTPIGPTPT